MANYELHVGAGDALGYGLIENVIHLASLGAITKPGTFPRMHFPHRLTMVIETDEPLYSTPQYRVFDTDNAMKEMIEGVVEPVAAVFSTDLGDTAKLTKDALEALQWEDFKTECKKYSIGGRDRAQMTKKYLA